MSTPPPFAHLTRISPPPPRHPPQERYGGNLEEYGAHVHRELPPENETFNYFSRALYMQRTLSGSIKCLPVFDPTQTSPTAAASSSRIPT